MTRPERRLLLGAFLAALVVRLWLIWSYPENFSMDGYQRWAGRDHLLVQDWLPGTQAVVYSVTKLGGGILETRVALAAVAALAVVAGALVARELGGLIAGWIFVPLSMFGPFLTWTVVPYQEGAYLLTILGAIALVLRGKRLNWAPAHRAWLLADLLAGAAALVRYEGWIFVGLYLLWRRDKRAIRAAWGAAFWLGLKLTGAQGYAASPVDFADWDGLTERFSSTTLTQSLRKLGRHATDTWLPALAVLGAAGAALLWRRKAGGLWMVLLLLGLQVTATLGWMIGLETATYRMQAVPGVLLGLLAAGGAGLALAGRGRWAPALAALVAIGLAAHFVPQGFDNARRSTRSAKWERKLVVKMARCEGCRWAVKPRRRIGTRKRHDGCEIVQGLGELRAGLDFWCTSWPGTQPFAPTHTARWRTGGYSVEGP